MGQILFDIIVEPLVLLIEFVFANATRAGGAPGVAIIFVSLAVNILCLPLYRMADAQQEQERARQKAMERWVTHIKRHFKGDERYMMLSAYYTIQGYRPAQALLGSLSLLLQIPFFMAAYAYLSHLEVLRGSSFLFLADLGAPDALLTLGGLTINLMPVAMTLFNCVSTAIYTRGLPARDKVQAYVLAALFLVLLYDSPSGLVFYWTCNQIFSLGKNVVMKLLPHREKPKHAAKPATAQELRRTNLAFFLGAALLTALLGVLVPSAVVAASPTEFINPLDVQNPLAYVLHTACVWGGTFILWTGTYYLLSGYRARRVFAAVIWCLCGSAMLCYFVFGRGLGTLSPELQFEGGVQFPVPSQIINAVAVVVLIVALIVLWRKAGKVVVPALAIGVASVLVLSVPNVVSSQAAYVDYQAKGLSSSKLFNGDGTPRQIMHLSRNNKNVMVLFLDRAISAYVPYMLNERPELERQLDGFTYYPNTLSYAQCTNFGAPALYGGYEYTPAAMNARSDELLKDKHNEALLLLPTLFSKAGYRTSVVDPPYAGDYQWHANVSLYDDLPNTEAHYINGGYTNYAISRYGVDTQVDVARRFVFYGLARVVPEFAQGTVYDWGHYWDTKTMPSVMRRALNELATLDVLPQITSTGEGEGCFVQFANCLTHEPTLLQLPDYDPAPQVENEGLEDKSRFTLNGRTMKVDSDYQLGHYHINMGAFIRLGRFFDWMRENGVYDNTRIIMVADHGRNLWQFADYRVDNRLDIEMVNPLLMVKDFDAHGFSTSNKFMTNADTPTLALAGLIKNPVNPATGKAINSDAKYAHDQVVSISDHWNTAVNNGTVFDSSDAPWYTLSGDDVFARRNWKRYETEPEVGK